MERGWGATKRGKSSILDRLSLIENVFPLQIKRINQLYVGGHRIAELHVLLDKEIQLFNGIERQRTKLRNHIVEVQTGKMLEKMGTPTKWVGYKGELRSNLSRKKRTSPQNLNFVFQRFGNWNGFLKSSED